MTVTATALAQNTALTLMGSAAEVVTGLVGDIAAGPLTVTLNRDHPQRPPTTAYRIYDSRGSDLDLGQWCQ